MKQNMQVDRTNPERIFKILQQAIQDAALVVRKTSLQPVSNNLHHVIFRLLCDENKLVSEHEFYTYDPHKDDMDHILGRLGFKLVPLSISEGHHYWTTQSRR